MFHLLSNMREQVVDTVKVNLNQVAMYLISMHFCFFSCIVRACKHIV